MLCHPTPVGKQFFAHCIWHEFETLSRMSKWWKISQLCCSTDCTVKHVMQTDFGNRHNGNVKMVAHKPTYKIHSILQFSSAAAVLALHVLMGTVYHQAAVVNWELRGGTDSFYLTRQKIGSVEKYKLIQLSKDPQVLSLTKLTYTRLDEDEYCEYSGLK